MCLYMRIFLQICHACDVPDCYVSCSMSCGAWEVVIDTSDVVDMEGGQRGSDWSPTTNPWKSNMAIDASSFVADFPFPLCVYRYIVDINSVCVYLFFKDVQLPCVTTRWYFPYLSPASEGQEEPQMWSEFEKIVIQHLETNIRDNMTICAWFYF